MRAARRSAPRVVVCARRAEGVTSSRVDVARSRSRSRPGWDERDASGVRETVFRLQAMKDATRRERARTRAETRWSAGPRARAREDVEGGN